MVVMERPTAAPVTTRTIRQRMPDGTVREYPTRGQHVIDFIERYCVHTKGRWRSKPFVLLPWEKKLLYELFEIDPVTGRRRYRWAYIEIPKKQGKTELIAAIDVYMLVADGEESPEIACAANSDEQADLVFGAAKAMCEMSPDLAALTTCYAKEIVLKENPAAKIARYSATVGTNDGKNLSLVALDELHEFKGPKGEGLFNVLTNATGARQEPLVIMITTAGFDLDTVCGRYHEQALKIIKGELSDPEFYARIYAADETLDLEDPAQWERAVAQANPSLGHTVDLPFYRDQWKRKPREVFVRYFLGIWTRGEKPWLPPGAWHDCAIAPFAFDLQRPIYAGVDASTKKDSTAVVCAQWWDDQLRIKARIWSAPRDPHTGQVADGWRLPIAEVENHIRELHRGGNLAAVAYDPAFITWMAASLEAEGVAMVEMPQTNTRMCPPTQALYELIIDQRLGHEGDPALARQMGDAVAKQVSGGGQRLVKTHDRRENDGPIALVMSVAEAGKPAEPSKVPQFWVFDDDEAGA